MRILHLLLISVIGLTASEGAVAQEELSRERVESLLSSSVIRINGKENPELVPFSTRMQHFFARFQRKETGYQDHFRSVLSAEDFAVLMDYAERHNQKNKEDEEAYMTTWMGIAARAERMSGIAIAAEVQAATEKTEAKQAARFQSVLSRLSREGQGTVRTFAFERERPMISKEDVLAIARAEPDFYKAQVLGTYELARSGKALPPPPDVGDLSQQASPNSIEKGRIGTPNP